MQINHTLIRCGWAKDTKIYRDYHDQEWGVPVHDDRLLFEFLILEGTQAGLSWETILNKREAYRQAFDNFDAKAVANYDSAKVAELLTNPGIVRNRLKITAAIENARSFLQIQAEYGSFDRYIWQFVNGRTIKNSWPTLKQLPVTTVQSDAMSKSLRSKGFKFVGSTISYAYMQAVGMVNDHLTNCFRYDQIDSYSTAD